MEDDLVSGAKSLIDFASSALSLSSGLQKLVGGTKAETEISKLHGVILSTYQSAIAAMREQLALEAEKVKLERKLEAIENWEAEAAKYEVAAIGEGVFAYRRKGRVISSEPAYLLCPNCFGARRKSFIQRTSEARYSLAQDVHLCIHKCHSCAAEFAFESAGGERRSRSTRARGLYDDDED